MQYHIEPITEFDSNLVQPISDMLVQLTEREAQFGEQELRSIIESPASQLFILRVDNAVAGMLTLGRYTSPTGTKVWVEDVVVSNQYRGQRLGRRLVEYAIEYCKAHFAPCTLMLTSNPKRVAANELYRTSGFESKQTNVYKMIFE